MTEQDEKIRKERELIEAHLGPRKSTEKGKETIARYLALREEAEQLYKEYDNIRDSHGYAKIYNSKSTQTKRIILYEVGGELLSVRANNSKRDEGVEFDELGKLERRLDDVQLQVSGLHHYDSWIRGIVPEKVELSEHERGQRLVVSYRSVNSGNGGTLNGQDTFDIFVKELLRREVLFMRYETPVGERLILHGGTWALGSKTVTKEPDRYGGLVAVRELANDEEPAGAIRSVVGRAIKSVQDYVAKEKEMSDRLIRHEIAHYESVELLGNNCGNELTSLRKKLEELGKCVVAQEQPEEIK